ncbi:glycosyltransferase family 2 protein [Bosea minatitlanensis]|uniref:Glycosyltransferase family 2 protein n=1 Tax=Bosea minatitlanensis TaxID=128782 RepID=A0ABW0FBV7_9HYPH|nr:glycosyltransferase family 2 protein [Bosea minatitlanensis]MCT4495495.1 glycosyltransferase family 2 protein [Bosea minatitlanensis]
MSESSEPLVSVVTPVYNGEKFLRECIESVLSQTYRNWEYIVLNNASTDGTLGIAEEYSRRDSRIRVLSNDALLPIIANHNRAFGLIAKDSKYCKVVSADDWIYPECLEKMVALAEAHPSVGIVGAYQLSGGRDIWYVRNVGLSYAQPVILGRDICRAQLLGTLRVLGNPTSVLYRADLVRSTDAFFPNPTQEADTSACLKHLRHADFGFVHQILTHERIHYDRVTTASLENNAYVSAEISDCQEYGDWYLTRSEKQARIAQLLDQYYAYLSLNAFKFRDRAFWDYHIQRLRDLGYRFDGRKLSLGIAAKAVDSVLNPKGTIQTISKRIRLHYMIKGMKVS